MGSDYVTSFIGNFWSIEEYKRVIDWLRQTAQSEVVKQAVSTI